MSQKTEGKTPTFEEALARLEKIVNMLESGEAGLDESLAVFEEGVSLVKLCNRKLAAAEQKVRVVTVGEDGAVREDDLPPREES